MKKELVAVKNRNYWDIIFDVSLSEGKNLSSDIDTINIIKNNYVELINANFIVEGIEIFVIVDNLSTVNLGNGCKF